MASEKSYTEKILLKLASEGDAAAFSQLFYLHKDRLYSFSLRLTASPELAQDIVQDVFLKIWKNKEQLETLDNFGAFIFKIAQNQAINSFKRMANQTLILSKIQLTADVYNRATEEDIERNEVQHLLDKALQKLPAQQNLVFKLSREQGLKNNEIAHLLKISPNTVKNHLVTALQSIRKYLRSNLFMERLPIFVLLLKHITHLF